VLLFDIELKKDAAAGPADIAANVRYQSCNDTICLPPKKKSAMASIAIDPSAKARQSPSPPATRWCQPVPAANAARFDGPRQPRRSRSSGDLGLFLLTAFGAGLAAIFTPCVFPMIPFTVSYFLNRQTGSKRDGVLHAVSSASASSFSSPAWARLIKAIAGPFGVVQLGNSPWVNGFIAAVFVVFGLSLLGAYELTLPSGLLTKMNQASEGGGYLGTLLMGLTFTLTSFACIGPIVGPLLVASVQTSGLQPVFGMASFATGLAAPFLRARSVSHRSCKRCPRAAAG
jgi:thiol:disulfide interchange protein